MTSYIVEWDSALLSKMEARRKTGLLAMRIDDCKITPLYDCRLEESPNYIYHGVSRKYDSVTMKIEQNINALFRYDSHRQTEQRIVNLVGLYDAPRSRFDRSELRGECAGVTHIITAIHVGARSDGNGERDAQTGALTSNSSEKTAERHGGQIEACQDARMSDVAPPENCGEPLAIEMSALVGEPASTATCPLFSAAPGLDADWALGPRPRKGLVLAGSLSLVAGAMMAVVGGVGVVRSNTLESEYNAECGVFPDKAGCAELDNQGTRANRLQIAGFVAAPLLAGAGVVTLAVAHRRKNYRRQALLPQVNAHTVAFTWKVDF